MPPTFRITTIFRATLEGDAGCAPPPTQVIALHGKCTALRARGIDFWRHGFWLHTGFVLDRTKTIHSHTAPGALKKKKTGNDSPPAHDGRAHDRGKSQ